MGCTGSPSSATSNWTSASHWRSTSATPGNASLGPATPTSIGVVAKRPPSTATVRCLATRAAPLNSRGEIRQRAVKLSLAVPTSAPHSTCSRFFEDATLDEELSEAAVVIGVFL